MSTKRVNNKKEEPPPKHQMIVTRHKSAQLKRQLREKDRSMKNLTQLLTKSPAKKEIKTYKVKNSKTKKGKTKEKQSQVKTKNEVKKCTSPKTPVKEVIKVVEKKEYYPNKLKRDVKTKKILLKPKHELKLIGGTKSFNRRKMCIPQKDAPFKIPRTDSWICSAPKQLCDFKDPGPNSELSMDEVIRMTEETESLTDEDLMEILTCPSPVWWEDSPDSCFMEDAICQSVNENHSQEDNTDRADKFQKKDIQQSNLQVPIIEENVNTTKSVVIPETAITKHGDKFLKKRGKLEFLLGNIKNRILGNVEEERPSETVLDTNLDLNINIINKNKNQVKINTEKKYLMSPDINKSRNSESTEGSFSDASLRDDEMLRDLENIEIPIEKSNSDECIVIGDDSPNRDNPTSFLASGKDSHNRDPSSIDVVKFLEISLSETPNTDALKKELVHVKFVKKKRRVNTAVPSNLPPLQKYPLKYIDFASLPSTKSVSEETIDSSSNPSNDMLDTISDTNIRFLDDDDEEVQDGDKVENSGKLNQFFLDSKSSDLDAKQTNDDSKSANTELITVYRIIQEDQDEKNEANAASDPEIGVEEVTVNTEDTTKLDTNVTNNGQINSFYKKYKNSHERKQRRKSVKRTDIPKTDIVNEKQGTDSKYCELCDPKVKKSIIVSDNKSVKYCLKCSSIFDTEECAYCYRKAQNSDKSFSCKTCGVRTCCVGSFKNHEQSHDVLKFFACDICNYQANSKEKVREHLLQHNCKGMVRQNHWDHCYALNQT